MAALPSSMMKCRRRIRSFRWWTPPATARVVTYHAPEGATIARKRSAYSPAECPNARQFAALSTALSIVFCLARLLQLDSGCRCGAGGRHGRAGPIDGIAVAADLGKDPVAPAAFDEMRDRDGTVRAAYAELAGWLDSISAEGLLKRRHEAELLFRRIGITFAVHGEAEAQERLIPFDVIPRILSGAEWNTLARGLEQRVRALNLFLKDVYSQREILRAGVVPEDLIFRNPVFRPEMNGQKVPHDLYVLIAGIDIVRVDADTFYVLEDNARTPSGV